VSRQLGAVGGAAGDRGWGGGDRAYFKAPEKGGGGEKKGSQVGIEHYGGRGPLN